MSSGNGNNSKLLWLKRLAGIPLFILFYFTLLRPFRNHFSTWVVDWITTGNAADYILNVEIMTRSFIVDYSALGTVLTVAYIPQFGFFFLLGMIGMIWFQSGYRLYGALTAAQIGFEILVLFSLWTGFNYSAAGLITANLLMVYLSPMVCLGFVLYLYLQKKGKI